MSGNSSLSFHGAFAGGVGGASFNVLGSPSYGAGLSTGLTGKLFGQTYNVFAYGAVGNGLSNPASSLYGNNLSALQSVYGTALNGVQVSLTQELDWLAAQKAISEAATTGGVVYFPAATYVLSNSQSISDGSGVLVLPSTYWANIPNYGVSILGDFPGTTLWWPSDLGAVCGISCGAVRNNGGSVGFIEGIVIKGPGVGTTFGSSTCQMQGIGSSDRRIITNVYATGFRAAINIVGGQTNYKNIVCFLNYYACYFDTPDPGNFGNIGFEKCNFGTSLMAGIGVNHAACISACTFYNCFIGASPFGIYKETNSGSPSQPQTMNDCEFVNTQFENIGQSAVGEDTYSSAPNGSNRHSLVVRSKFIECQYGWDTLDNNTLSVSGSTKYSWFDIGQSNGLQIIGITQPYQMTPGTYGIIHPQSNNGIYISGDIGQLISNCNSASSPYNNQPVVNAVYQYGGVVVENTVGASPWKGSYGGQYIASGDLVAGQFVCESPTANGAAYANLLAPCAGTSTEAPIGVIMHVGASGNFSPRLYAYEGYVTINVDSATNGGVLLRTSTTAGALTTASGPFETTSPIVAFGFGVGTSGAGQMLVRLRNLS